MSFQDRVAIVTGGSGALGSAVALDLAANGTRVAVPYTREEHWEALQTRASTERDRLWGAKADMTTASAVEQFVAGVLERWGRVDFLVCIAGGFAAEEFMKPLRRIGTGCSILTCGPCTLPPARSFPG